MLRTIRTSCEDSASALAVYCALTVIASDVGRDEFQTTHKWIASLSGFSERTVRERLHELTALKLISVSTPKLKTPSTYRLLAFGNHCRTSGNGETTFTPVPLPPLEERRTKKRRTKRHKETPVSQRVVAASNGSGADHRPSNAAEVIDHALRQAGVHSKPAARWLASGALDHSVGEILDLEMSDAVREALSIAFRFIRYNNLRGWNLEHSWQAAFAGFKDNVHLGNGDASAPLGWVPVIEVAEEEYP